MKTRTNEQVARAKEQKSVTGPARTPRTKVNDSEEEAIPTARTTAERSSRKKAVKKGGSAKAREAKKPLAKPAATPKAATRTKALDEMKSAVEQELAKSAGKIGAPIKPLTEAGKKRLVNKLLGLADSQATQGAFKITPADLIRLMQLHRDMNPAKDHKKVTVQWIEDKAE